MLSGSPCPLSELRRQTDEAICREQLTGATVAGQIDRLPRIGAALTGRARSRWWRARSPRQLSLYICERGGRWRPGAISAARIRSNGRGIPKGWTEFDRPGHRRARFKPPPHLRWLLFARMCRPPPRLKPSGAAAWRRPCRGHADDDDQPGPMSRVVGRGCQQPRPRRPANTMKLSLTTSSATTRRRSGHVVVVPAHGGDAGVVPGRDAMPKHSSR